jgi:hypothetical protein
MLSLDRGAIEVKMAATTRDVVMTPDLRFTVNADGPLDLHLRVTKNGDTCVENLGGNAPLLHIADPFGEGAYELRAGQHVLFEHASLKEVVDQESSACGCPPAPAEPAMTVADALLNSSGTGTKAAPPPTKAAEQHPFPAAVSEGLAPAASVPQAPVGAVHSQVSATLSSNGAADSTAAPTASSSQVAAGTGAESTSTPASGTTGDAAADSQPHSSVFHAIGRFFKRIFGAD